MVSLSRLLSAADDAPVAERPCPPSFSRLLQDCPLPSSQNEDSISPALRLALSASLTNSNYHVPHSSAIPISQMLRDFGPESTSPNNMLTLARALSHFGRPSELAVASALLFLTSPGTQDSVSEDSHSLFHIFALFCAHMNNPSNNPVLQQAINSDLNSSEWRLDVFIQAVSAVATQFNAPLNWRLVIHAFDTENLSTRLSDAAFINIASSYISATGESLPADYFIDDWQHPSAQICMLRYVLSSKSLIDWSATAAFEGAMEEELINPFSRVSLMEKLIELDAQDLLQECMKLNANVMLMSLAFAKPRNNSALLKRLTMSLFFSLVSSFPHSERTLRFLWTVEPALVKANLISLWRKDFGTLRFALRLGLGLEILGDLLSSTTSLEFSLDLAILAYCEDVLNFETWLTGILESRGSQVISETKGYLSRKIRTGDPPDATKLPLEAVRIIFRCLGSAIQKCGVADVLELRDQIREVMNAYIRLNPRIADLNVTSDAGDHNARVGTDIAGPSAPAVSRSIEAAPTSAGRKNGSVMLDAAATAATILFPLSGGPSPGQVGFPSEVDKEADVFFQKLYQRKLPPEQAVERLSALKSSPSDRDRQIFNCAMHTLFDEYRFFLKYPDPELKITGVLFGSVIQHALLSGKILTLAIRCVLDALRTVEPPPQPIGRYAKFGLCALEKMRSRLSEWPHFCSHVLSIPRLEDIAPALIGEVRKAVQQSPVFASLSESGQNISAPSIDMDSSHPVLSVEDGVPPPVKVADPADTAKDVSTLLASPTISTTTTPVKASMSSTSLRASPSVTADGHLGLSPLNLTVLLGMSTDEASKVIVPDETTQDKIKFIFNNLSSSTMENKVAEMLNILKPDIQQYLSVYIVVKRASSESNFHSLYVTFLDKIDSHLPKLYPLVYDTSYRRVRVLLASDVKSSNERLTLKSLGSWIGSITLARNKPIRRKELDLKELLMSAYSNGKLNIVVPFVSKVLEACGRSVIFKTSNPWVRGVLSLMKEIYLVDDLKLNMKLELQLLTKTLKVDVNDVICSDLLRGRPAPDKEQNPDFNTKKQPNSSPQRASPAGSPPPELQQSYLPSGSGRTSIPTFTLSEAQPSSEPRALSVPSTQPLNSGPPNVPQGLITSTLSVPGDVSSDISSMLANTSLSSAASTSGFQRTNVHSYGGVATTVASADQQIPAASSFNQSEQMLIPSLAQYIQISPSLVLFQTAPQLKRLIPLAIDRAIREIIQPVVERSCAIAFLTTKELTLKDFANEPDVGKIRRAALQMVQQLAGSLALVTSKEPLRVSMGNQLLLMLSSPANAVSADQNLIEQTAQMVSTANLDIGCAIIERHAKERSARDLNEKIGSAFVNRRPQHSSYTYGALPGPEVHRIYDDFSRLHRASVSPPQYEPSSTTLTSTHTHGTQQPNATAPASQVQLQSQLPSQSLQPFLDHRVNGLPVETQPEARPIGHQTVSHHPLSSHSTAIIDVERSETNHGVIGTRRANAVPIAAPALQVEALSTVYGTPLGPMASPTSVAAAILAAAGSSSTSSLQGSNGSASLSSSNVASGEEALSTQQVLERFNSLYPRLVLLIKELSPSRDSDTSLADVPSEHELHTVWTLIPAAVKRSVTADEAGMAVAQKLFKRLYDGETNLYREVHVLILDGIRECCRRLSKEISSWLAFSEDRKKLNRDCIVALMRSPGLLNISAYDEILAKSIDNGRNIGALDFACFLIRKSIIDESIATSAELYVTLETLAKIARRQNVPYLASCPEGLVSLVDQARSVMPRNTASNTGAIPSSQLGNGNETGSGKMQKDLEPSDPAGTREFVAGLLLEWYRIVSCDTSTRPISEPVVMSFLGQVRSGMLSTEDSRERFLRITVELVSAATRSALQSKGASPVASDLVQNPYTIAEATVRLIGSLCRMENQQGNNTNHEGMNICILSQFLIALVKDILKGGARVDLRAHYRLFAGLMGELCINLNRNHQNQPGLNRLSASYFTNALADRLSSLKGSSDCIQYLDDGGRTGYIAMVRSAGVNGSHENEANFDDPQVIVAIVGALTACSPTASPAFAFSWLQLISSKELLPNLLSLKTRYGWPLFRHLMTRMLDFLGQFLRDPPKILSTGVSILYNGMLRVLLVLLHDFPEFLCSYHMTFCEVIPANCVQLRNLVLASFPKDMRLPDPLNPDLNVDEVLEMSPQPLILSDYMRHLDQFGIRVTLDKVLLEGFESGFDVKSLLKVRGGISGDRRYNPNVIAAVVMYAGEFGIERGGRLEGTWVELIRRLVQELEPEGRHLALLGIANQLRFPNKHTMFFSRLVLSFFLEFTDETLKEHLTRVLIERLIANRPHPWGLLITFVQLIKKREYNFWGYEFVRCAPEIEQLFENVAKFCVGPVLYNKLPSTVSASG